MTAARICAEVIHGAAEPVRLAQDRDGDRATGLVGAGSRDDVVRLRRDLPGRRRAALDLGDEVQAGRREAFREGARGRSGGDAALELDAVERRPARAGDRPGADRRSRRRRRVDPGRCPTRVPFVPRAARFGVAAMVMPGSRSRSSPPADVASLLGAPRAGVPAGRHRSRRVPPRRLRRARSRHPRQPWLPPRSARTTSRRGPGSPVKIDSMIAAFSAAVPPASAAVGARPRPSPSTSTEKLRIPPPVTSRTMPVPSSGSSSTPSPLTTSVRSVPSSAATSAIRSAAAGSPTPISARRAPAGFVSGPMRLNDVRIPISRRVGPACCIAGWKLGANMNAKPCSRSAAPADAAS